MEAEFGITEYLAADLPGFDCTFKQRYSDFVVNEIDVKNQVVHLTSLTVAPSMLPEAAPNEVEKRCYDGVLTEETVRSINDLVEGKVSQATIDCKDMTKEQRTAIHQSIREQYRSALESRTVTKDDMTSIVIEIASASDRKKRKFWPKDSRGDYCQFVLFKENRDTPEAISIIARLLSLRSSNISVAGNKDRRAVTSQLATVYRIDAGELAALNDRLYGIKLGNFHYCDDQVNLGCLTGNRFTVVLRNVSVDDAHVDKCVESWKQNGFINYYGCQRFGTGDIHTFEIGKLILQRKWKEAVDRILQSRAEANESMAECYKTWQTTRDPAETMKALPDQFKGSSLESHLLRGLKKVDPNDYCGALKYIPRNSRNLYLHGYQSLLWNITVSRRLQKFGHKLLIGDLVVKNGDKSTPQTVTEDNFSQWTFDDVVIPLLSAEFQLPRNETADIYRDLMREEEIATELWQKASKHYALHGANRKLIVKPLDIEHHVRWYNSDDDSLVATDLDTIKGSQPAKQVDSEGALRKAVLIKFSLPAGCYATCALRELCRVDMSKKFQSSLGQRQFHRSSPKSEPASEAPSL